MLENFKDQPGFPPVGEGRGTSACWRIPLRPGGPQNDKKARRQETGYWRLENFKDQPGFPPVGEGRGTSACWRIPLRSGGPQNDKTFALPVSCFLFPVSCFLFPVSCLLFPVSCLPDARLLFPGVSLLNRSPLTVHRLRS